MIVHETALQLGNNFGMTDAEIEAEIVSIGKAMERERPGFFLGGFNADVIAIALTAVLRLEQDTEHQFSDDDNLHPDRVRALTVNALVAAYEGVGV